MLSLRTEKDRQAGRQIDRKTHRQKEKKKERTQNEGGSGGKAES